MHSPGERARLTAIQAEAWDRVVGPAVLDEVQKSPSVLDKLKWAYDEGKVDFSVLLGSSRIMLLEQVRESMAGRVFLYELWPMTAGRNWHPISEGKIRAFPLWFVSWKTF